MFKDLPLNALRAFEATARLGEVKLAAAELFVTPAAVSQQLKKLEQQLALNLWLRQGNKMVLTATGERLYAICHQSLADLYTGIEALKPNDVARKVRLQVPSTMATLWLIPRLGDFYRQHPNIEVQIVTSHEWRQLDVDLNIDVFLRCLPKNLVMDSHFGYQYLFDEHMSVYAAPHFNWQQNLSLIGINSAEALYQNLNWETWLKRHPRPDFKINNLRVFDTEHDAIYAAISGYGLVLASDVLVSKSVEEGLLKSLFPQQGLLWEEQYYAVYRLGRQRQEGVAALLTWLSEQADLFVEQNKP